MRAPERESRDYGGYRGGRGRGGHHRGCAFLLRSYSLLGGGCVLGTDTVAYISFFDVSDICSTIHTSLINRLARFWVVFPRLWTEPKSLRLVSRICSYFY